MALKKKIVATHPSADSEGQQVAELVISGKDSFNAPLHSSNVGTAKG